MDDESRGKLRNAIDDVLERLKEARALLDQPPDVFEVITQLSTASGRIEGVALYLWTEGELKRGSERALKVKEALNESESELGPGSTLLQNWSHIRWRRRNLFENFLT